MIANAFFDLLNSKWYAVALTLAVASKSAVNITAIAPCFIVSIRLRAVYKRYYGAVVPSKWSEIRQNEGFLLYCGYYVAILTCLATCYVVAYAYIPLFKAN